MSFNLFSLIFLCYPVLGAYLGPKELERKEVIVDGRGRHALIEKVTKMSNVTEI